MRKGFVLRPLLPTDERPFDQTNGMIREEQAVLRDADRVGGRLLAAGVAVNAVSIGFFVG